MTAQQGVPQFGSPFTDKYGNITQVWYQFLVNLSIIAGGAGFAPAGSDYVVSASDVNLPNADVATNSTTITWDFSTANQAKLNVTISSIVIPESQVINLTTDLANRALTATQIIAGSGLTGGGTLNANVTVSLAQMAPLTVKGNNTGSTANAIDLSQAQLAVLLNGQALNQTSITFSTTSGIIGTTTNNNAAAGSVGEYISSTVLIGGAVGLSSGSGINITSISLTAGDWDVFGTFAYLAAVGTATVAYGSSINTVTGTMAVAPNGGYTIFPANNQTGISPVITLGTIRMSLATTTTVFLIGFGNFSGSTASGYGFIGARRAR